MQFISVLVLKMASRVVFLLLICCLTYQEAKCDQSAIFCSEWLHHTYGKGYTCCDHKLIHSGVNENTHWEECALHPKNEKENYTSSLWRVYSCVLAKSLPAKETKITFSTFATLMTSNYTAALKKSILEKVKTEVGAGKKAYLKDSVLLTNYVQLDKIRAAYFDIEKTVCGLKDKAKEEKWDNCGLNEEVNHREGDCCGKTPVPFVDHHLDAFQYFVGETCSKTLDKKVKATKLKDKDDIATFLDECKFACFLIEEKLITLDDFVKVTSKSKIEPKNIVKKFVPTYLSETVEQLMLKYVKDHLKLAEVMKDLPDTILGDKVKPVDELLGCYAYNQIYELTKRAAHSHCDSLHYKVMEVFQNPGTPFSIFEFNKRIN